MDVVAVAPVTDHAPALHIRRGVPADALQLAGFAARVFADAFGADTDPGHLRAHLAASYGAAQQGRELADPAVATLLAFAGDALVAYAQVRTGTPPPCVATPRTVELQRFYVDRAARGTGVAQALMAQVRRAARDQFGAAHLWLGVWERNPRAIAFYARCGLVDVGSKPYFVGADEQTDRVMVGPVDGVAAA
jgi:GNAT superfamily N-acetyltransferase